MPTFYVLTPEVAGIAGDHAVRINPLARPQQFSRFHIALDYLPEDPIVEVDNNFAVTRPLADKLKAIAASGFALAPVEISTSDTFDDLNHDKGKIPAFQWLKLTGKPGVDDFGLAKVKGADPDCSPLWRLVVSKRVLDALRAVGIKFCEVKPWP
jgi:hypothetical protein